MNLFCFDNSDFVSSIADLYFPTLKKIVSKCYKKGDRFYIWGDEYTKKSYNEI